MLGEHLSELDQQPAEDLPVLTPRLVAPESEVDELIRRGRAQVALLTLKLRSTLHEASQTGQLDESSIDIDGAHELLQASLYRHLEKRRADFADAVERARLEAAAIVAVAHHEAAALVATANGAIVETLLDGVSAVPDDAAPSLRVVEEDEVADHDARSDHPTRWSGQAVAPPVEAPVVIVDDLPARPDPPARAPLVTEVHAPAPHGRWSIKQFLYLDVVLPLIAVMIVIIVLLAWVG